MKLVYLTSKNYPAKIADNMYARELARAFDHALGDDFLFVVANDHDDELSGMRLLNLHLDWHKHISIYYLLWVPRFYHSLRRSDVVFFSNDSYLLMILIFWKKCFGLRYTICSDWHQLFGDRRDRIIARSSDRLVTTSRKLADSLVRLSARSDHVHVVYGGVNMSPYQDISPADARSVLGLPPNTRIVAYVGFFKTMGMEKGIKTMIKSLTFLENDIIMLFVGGTDKEIAEYREVARTLSVDDRCIFVGRKDFDDIVLYEQAADILAIPYPDQPHFRECGFPMKVYEYMASRRPIVYSKLDLVEEVIGDCAMPFKPDDSADFAHAVTSVLSDRERSARNVEHAFKKIQNYTWDKKAEMIVSLTQKTI